MIRILHYGTVNMYFYACGSKRSQYLHCAYLQFSCCLEWSSLIEQTGEDVLLAKRFILWNWIKKICFKLPASLLFTAFARNKYFYMHVCKHAPASCVGDHYMHVYVHIKYSTESTLYQRCGRITSLHSQIHKGLRANSFWENTLYWSLLHSITSTVAVTSIHRLTWHIISVCLRVCLPLCALY